MVDFNPKTENLLMSSVAQYSEILRLTEELLKMVETCEYSHVNEYAARSQQLQREASRHDEELLPLLTVDLQTWGSHLLYQKRLDNIRSIVELNKMIIPKIQGVMAITKAELDNLNGGRNALVGYASQVADKRVSLGVG